MITVHHLNNSRSQRVLWLLEELGVPYEIVKYERDPQTMLSPKSLEAVHPLGKSPVITDNGQSLAESGAILEYLVETYGNGRFVPVRGTPAWNDYRYFMHYAEGSLMPYLLLKLIFRKVKTSPMPFIVKPVAKGIADKIMGTFVDPNLVRHLKFLNDHLTKHTWFAGDELTAADIQMGFPVESAVARGGDLADISKLSEFVKRIKARPAFQRAIERGGAYELLG
ncbi:MAG TPA: glutathione S-transferase [Kofleriaceae bacterium]|nr:glutathione S-transferase [Kofleriaceae bacterium]